MTRRPTLTSARAERLQAQQAAAYRRTVRSIEKRRHANQRFPDVDAPAPGRIRLVADEPPISVTVLTADDLDADGGAGGWEEIARDRRTPAIQHAGVPRATLTIPAIIDAHELRIDDVKLRVTRLYNMARVDETTGEPARIKLLGDTPAYNPLWVIDGIKPGRILRDRETGDWVQATLSIALSEWEDTSVAVTLPPAATRAATGKTKVRLYRTRQGDTLRRIALAQLGSQAQWKTLLADNRKILKGVDPDALLEAGITLHLTASTSSKA